MQKLLKILAAGLLILVLILGAVWFGGRRYLVRSIPVHSGEVAGLPLAQPVEISFDARGIPRIRARSDRDLFFAAGYVHASDRLFQMELVRRLARGELAEIFGEIAYDMDVKQRKIGFGRKAVREAADLSSTAKSMLESYSSGVNSFISKTRQLPPEFTLLGFRPRPWTPADSLAIALYQTWFSHELMDMDEVFQKLAEKTGTDIESLAKPHSGVPYPWSPPTVPAGPLSQLLGKEEFPWRMSAASNSWAISPQRSASGSAIHASDPHLAINQAPGLWYLAALHSDEGMDAVGVTQPGLPFVVMGHNGSISFAFTVASVDIIDWYSEEISSGSPATVMTPDGPRAMEEIAERIQVKGEKAPRLVRVQRTPRGPLMKRDGQRGISMHWAGFDFSAAAMMDAGMALQRARDFRSFQKAVTGFGALDANWVYADRNGNIGYQLGVPVPVRSYDDTFSLHPGAAASFGWEGYLPLEETPHAHNPEQGFLASCNNQPVGANWPHPLPGFYDPYRITRAVALLAAESKWTREKTERMQLDRVSGRALRWKDFCTAGAEKLGEEKVAEELRGWDGNMETASRPAGLFALCWHFLTKSLFEDELGNEWPRARSLQEHVLSNEKSPVVDDHRTPEIESKEDIAALAMKQALVAARGRSFGEMSVLSVRHPLASVKPLDWWLRLSRGPVSMGGDPGSLNANFYEWNEKRSEFRSLYGPSMRFVLDWADPDSFSITIAFGQSGNPFSIHYDDFFLPSLRGERWTVPFSRDKQAASETSRLTLLR